MNRKTLLTRLGTAARTHYESRINSDQLDGLFEIDQGEHHQPARPFPWKTFIPSAARWIGVASCVSFLFYVAIGAGEIGIPGWGTVLVMIFIGTLIALHDTEEG